MLLCMLPSRSFLSTCASRAAPVLPAFRGSDAKDNREFQGFSEQASSEVMVRLAALAVMLGVMAGVSSPARAFFGTGNSGEVIGEIGTSGLVFKDTLNVERITDPKVSGVTLYQTDFSKSGIDKMMSGNLLQSDSGNSGLACIADGKVLIKPDLSKDKGGEEIFNETKGLGKSLKVRRVYDEKSKNLVYVVYTERLQKGEDANGSRFKSSACAIHVDGTQ
eukprot:CAMPEP_0197628832 /NCGR_PEP_ID=MMETSP1338-20131121/6961_1 /TAXON_ID=43686 ORGANISM="Pelagodinium beii, Strain RCC1491" /NCGR_SAMPLE_ID=MMETSP1338 /ASSEMBLY_ACC=CAM_ASM_000754 /LENGTH=219 /DNA_ID=CAMNT_0043199833 /DNA_START=113 /DNA_END=772 /DNA_ORIENTATION=+